MHTDFEGVEKYLKSLPALSLRGISNKEPLAGFIWNLLNYYTTDNLTIENGETLGKGIWRRRSIGDIYRLCLTYAVEPPTLRQVIEELFCLVSRGKIWTLCCCDIHKRVWRTLEPYGEVAEFAGPLPVDEYDLDYSEYIKRYEIPIRTWTHLSTEYLKEVDYEQQLAEIGGSDTPNVSASMECLHLD